MATISVTWDSTTGRPSAPDITVRGNSAQVITWIPDSTVNITGITTPTSSAGSDFTPPAQLAGCRNWQCSDNLANSGVFSYTISGSPVGGGAVMGHDPQITNDRTG